MVITAKRGSKRHHLLHYSDDASIIEALKSIDRFVKERNLFRCYFCPPGTRYTEILSKRDW
jgi:hypothetical protein